MTANNIAIRFTQEMSRLATYRFITNSPKKRVMKQKSDVLLEIERPVLRVAALGLDAVLWLYWVDAFDDAESVEGIDVELELLDCFVTRNETSRLSCFSLEKNEIIQ